MKHIAIITARGGSKRIPRKNIKDFMGKPMLAYAIAAALESGVFDEVMVSTDDEEIATIAREFGASVPFMRATETSDDFATTFDVIDEVICEYRSRGIVLESFCCIYPCVPFLTATQLHEANHQYQGHDALIPVCQFPVPIEWAQKIENNLLIPVNRDAQNLRSQDITPKYFDAGMFYFCKVTALYEHKSLCPTNTTAYIMDAAHCQDIDTAEDWHSAELKYKLANLNAP